LARIRQPSIFSWRDIEAQSDLDRLKLVLTVLPDERLVEALELRRGHGRDDSPVRPMFNAVVAGIVYNHTSMASLRRELSRNGELRDLCGFDPCLGAGAVPTKDSCGRFLRSLLACQALISEIFHALLGELAGELPGLGRKLAVDSKALPSFGAPPRGGSDDSAGTAAQRKKPDRRREEDADWGTKTYKGKRRDGTAWEKVVRWFGFKLHLLVDSVYELPLGSVVEGGVGRPLSSPAQVRRRFTPPGSPAATGDEGLRQ
jgi:hypothetical protein